jgi:hypothetical protein
VAGCGKKEKSLSHCAKCKFRWVSFSLHRVVTAEHKEERSTTTKVVARRSGGGRRSQPGGYSNRSHRSEILRHFWPSDGVVAGDNDQPGGYSTAHTEVKFWLLASLLLALRLLGKSDNGERSQLAKA